MLEIILKTIYSGWIVEDLFLIEDCILLEEIVLFSEELKCKFIGDVAFAVMVDNISLYNYILLVDILLLVLVNISI